MSRLWFVNTSVILSIQSPKLLKFIIEISNIAENYLSFAYKIYFYAREKRLRVALQRHAFYHCLESSSCELHSLPICCLCHSAGSLEIHSPSVISPTTSLQIFHQGLYHATMIKIQEKYWKNEHIREVAYSWTRSIRLFSLSRLMFVAAVTLGGDIYTNRTHLVMSFLLDIYLLSQMTVGRKFNGVATKHRQPEVPTRIQIALTMTELVMIGIDLNTSNYWASM